MNTVMNLRVPKIAGNFLTGRGAVNFCIVLGCSCCVTLLSEIHEKRVLVLLYGGGSGLLSPLWRGSFWADICSAKQLCCGETWVFRCSATQLRVVCCKLTSHSVIKMCRTAWNRGLFMNCDRHNRLHCLWGFFIVMVLRG